MEGPVRAEIDTQSEAYITVLQSEREAEGGLKVEIRRDREMDGNESRGHRRKKGVKWREGED